jgi:hypothetical protein
MVCVAAVVGCGSKSGEEVRIELLAKDPSASFKAWADEFLAGLAKKGDWTAAGSPETKIGPAPKEEAGDFYEEGGHLGLLSVTLADKDKKETVFKFVCFSSPTNGTWVVGKVGTVDPKTKAVAPYTGDIDVFHSVSAELWQYRP